MVDDKILKEVRGKAARFCASRERSPREVLDKLESWGVAPGDSERILEELVKDHFVNEERFARAFCHDKFEFNSWGKQKIKAYIRLHEVSDEMIRRGLEGISDEVYMERLKLLAGKKWKLLEKVELPERKRKVVNYLAGKGFETELIWKAIHLLTTGTYIRD